MSQGQAAPEFGVIAPPLATGVSSDSGSPISFNSSGQAILGAKSTGSPLVAGLAIAPRSDGETLPVRFAGPLTLTTAQWDAVAKVNGSAASGGLAPGTVYYQWSGGTIDSGTGSLSSGDVEWVVGVALSSTTLLICPRRHAVAN